MTVNKLTAEDDCVKVGMQWLYGYHDNEYLRKINLKQIENAIRYAVQESRKGVVPAEDYEKLTEKIEKIIDNFAENHNLKKDAYGMVMRSITSNDIEELKEEILRGMNDEERSLLMCCLWKSYCC